MRPLGMQRLGLLLIAICVYGLAAGNAQAETVAAIKPSFSPDRLGAATGFTLALDFGGEHQRVPAPIRTSVVHLPAGLGLNVHGIGICQPARLRTVGPKGCPASSVVGRGHALMEAELGALVITEEATLEAFRGPNRGGRSVLEISGQGLTPLIERVTFTGVVVADRAPYGVKLLMTIPPIPTVPTEPDASTVKFSLTLGGAGTQRGSVTVPRECPAGGFPFASEFGFADGSTTSATAQVACP
jgi:hypothetical protein